MGVFDTFLGIQTKHKEGGYSLATDLWLYSSIAKLLKVTHRILLLPTFRSLACQPMHQTRDVRWSKFVGTGKERNTFPFKNDLSLARFFSFFLFPRTDLSSLSYLSWD